MKYVGFKHEDSWHVNVLANRFEVPETFFLYPINGNWFITPYGNIYINYIKSGYFTFLIIIHLCPRIK